MNFSGAAMQHAGKMIGIVGVARDMSQIRAIIHDLEEKKKEFEERSKFSNPDAEGHAAYDGRFGYRQKGDGEGQ